MGPIRYLILLVAVSRVCEAYRILVVFPLPTRSHGILGEGYVRHLLEAGHEVTYITPYPVKNSNPKLHQVDVSENIESFPTSDLSIKQILDKENNVDMSSILPKILSLSRSTILNENVQKILNDPKQSFDVVIGEWILSEMYAGFPVVFNCPFIWSSSVEPHWMVLKLIHEPSNPAFNPDAFSAAVPPFNFLQRVRGIVLQLFITGLQKFYILPKETELYKELFGPVVAKRGRELPPYEDVIYNASMLLSNSHASLGQPLSVPPNSKEIGGYHIDTDVKPLPVNLQKIMDEAKHGVIYFSMGSIAKSKDFPGVVKRDILQILGDLKQTVIWKFEEDLPNKPKNVHIVQWAPQTSILGHPNCQLFITHGGLLSTTETVYYGVPTVVIPMAGDQYINAGRAVNKGFAIKVELSYEMAGELKKAIDEVLNNPKYTVRVKELSKLYHDRLVPPGKELVHWVEHVVRTGGAPHLRSPALMLPWYQKMYLDLFVVIVVVLYTMKFVFIKIKNVFSKKKGSSQKKTN